MARDLLDAADQAGPPGMAFIYVWLRLSANRQLDWYRNSNYQSKDIAHVQKVNVLFNSCINGSRKRRHFWFEEHTRTLCGCCGPCRNRSAVTSFRSVAPVEIAIGP